MDKILEELWYGNIDPMEAVGSGGPQYKELMELMARNVNNGSKEPLARSFRATSTAK